MGGDFFGCEGLGEGAWRIILGGWKWAEVSGGGCTV